MNYYNKKKGQAAMEFLMTYGWAILAAIVVIAVLAIYFRPSSIVAGNQVLTAPLSALGSTFLAETDSGDGDGEARLEFKNNGGELINLASATLSITTPNGDTCNDAASGDFLVNGVAGTALDVGDIAIVNFDGCTFETDDNVNAQVSIIYTASEGTLDKTASGSINGKAADQ